VMVHPPEKGAPINRPLMAYGLPQALLSNVVAILTLMKYLPILTITVSG